MTLRTQQMASRLSAFVYVAVLLCYNVHNISCQVPQSERDALEDLKTAIPSVGASWTSTDPWTWSGVTCVGGRVTEYVKELY